MKQSLLPLFLFMFSVAFSQSKKPLNHGVYDGWKSIGQRIISNDGNYIVYAVNPQEGDGELVVQNVTSSYKKVIPRGTNAIISDDSKYLFFSIKPVYSETRADKIKKKKPDEMQKDSLGILELRKDKLVKIQRVKSFKIPEKAAGWVAYLFEKDLPDSSSKGKPAIDSIKSKNDLLIKLADSIIRYAIDSINGKIEKEELVKVAQKAAKEILKKRSDSELNEQLDAEGDDEKSAAKSEGTTLVLKRTGDSLELSFKLVNEYYFDKKGTRLLVETTKDSKDSNSKALLLFVNLATLKTDTISTGFNDCKNYAMDETGDQLAFVAERDSSTKALQKFYKLWYYSSGQDTAILLADKNSIGIKLGNTISENGKLEFSKDGKKLYFGVAPVQPPKDTMLVDFELARLDVWHYNDDYLQPQQLKQLDAELKRSYLAVTIPGSGQIVQLGDEEVDNIYTIDEGNADYVLGTTTKGNRISMQWTGRGYLSGYLISTKDGSKKLIKKDVLANMQPSPNGKFVYWYQPDSKNYYTYETATGITRNITGKIKLPLYDTENDVPDYPRSAGTSGWTKNDEYFLINDEYDIWKIDPTNLQAPVNITNGFGRKTNTSLDYVSLDPEERFISETEPALLKSFNKLTKYAGFYTKKITEVSDPTLIVTGPYSFSTPVKARDINKHIVQRNNISESELFASDNLKQLTQLTDIASQQKEYNWLTVELVKWKMFDGKMSEGLLYKPANFDPNKKYPIIFYFYERNSDGLYNYRPPAPSASIINVPYFVSNGYLVFDPNIYYKVGEPGQSAYNSVVSAAKFLSKKPWVDSTRMALQGQSWGGYQIAYLVTRTNIFRAAGAGAPVANMTSAYGGIRWGSGVNRQFQYERTQSRIGATLWQRPDLYIKNSPLFAADKITTPLLLTHNDADDAVPWYQGIEFFTALRRLGKKVWMLQYNGEAHNLTQRKNRKDLSVRLSQFFDYYLKDAPPANWIKYGVPATQKGKDWGLEVE
ncbi:MAG: prolyl oligopeptidase family serine peptidase [Ferruginibacter sp.]